MVEDERESNDGLEGPRRKTYAPPEQDAVFTGSFPVIDDVEPANLPEPTPPVVPQPRAATDPPLRQSLTDAEIFARFEGGQAGSTAEMIAELERQVSLRQDEEEAFAMWANLVRATRGANAEAIIARERIIFDGGEPEPEPEPEPAPAPEVVSTPPEVELVEVVETDSLDIDAALDSDSLMIPVDPVEDEIVSDGDEELAELVADAEPELEPEIEVEPGDQWPLVQKADTSDQGTVEEKSEQGVPVGVTRVTAGLLWMWTASLVPVLGVMAGAFLVFRGLGVWESVVAIVGAGVVTGLVIAAGATRQKRRGEPTLRSAQTTFGRQGNAIPTTLLTLIRSASLAVVIVFAVSVALRVVELSGLWPYEVWIAELVVAGLVAAGVVTLGLLGGRVLRMALWVSAVLGGAGFVVLVVLLAPSLSREMPLWGPDWLSVVGALSLVLSGFLLLWGTGGGDLTDLRVGSGRTPVSVATALGGIVPLALVMMFAVWVAASTPGSSVALVTDPVGVVVSGLPSWYPAPALILGVLPLVVLGAWILFSTGRGLESMVPLGRMVATSSVAVLALAGVASVLVLSIDIARYIPDGLITLGVVLAAWSGAFAMDTVLANKDGQQAVPNWRIAPLAGMVLAIGLGLGLVSSSLTLLSWQGYLLPILESAGLLDLSNAAPGVLVALVVSALVTTIATVGTKARVATQSDE